MKQVERGWDEFWAEMFRIKHRRCIPGIRHYDEMLAEFCIQSMGLRPDAALLDIACGAGDHSVLFGKKGLKVTGFDISKTLIDAAKQLAKDSDVDITFYTGDMREIDFDQQFDAAVILSHSFGFFDHKENAHVLNNSFRALNDEGKLLLDLMNPYNLPRFQRTWSLINGGYLLSEPHMLDAPSGVLRGRPATYIDMEEDTIVKMNENAMSNNDIRMYTALEIRELLNEVGFTKVEFYGQNKLPRMPYSSTSERMVVIASR